MMWKPDVTRYGMVIDVDKCTGCGACSVACMSENNVGVLPDETDKIRSITWMRVYQIDNGRSFPETEIAFFPRPCMHCEGGASGTWTKDGEFKPDKNPHIYHTPCVSVCPATATDFDPDTGIVSQIPTRCIGCRYCVAACPYHARYFNWYDVPWPKGAERALSPFVSPRMRGVVEKCTFCHHRRQLALNKLWAAKGKGTDADIPEQEYQTACTQACPVGAITFGQLNNPKHEVHKLIQSPHAFRLLERLGTNPKVYYLSKREWVRRKADNYQEGEKLNKPRAAGGAGH